VERSGLDENRLAPVVRASAARRIHGARALAARILVEIARARDPRGTAPAAKGILERAFAHEVENDELDLFVSERDPLLETADSLRALLLAAQAQEFLSARSASWWLSKENGAWLVKAFSGGSRLSATDLAHSFGAPRLDAGALDRTARKRGLTAGVSSLAHP